MASSMAGLGGCIRSRSALLPGEYLRVPVAVPCTVMVTGKSEPDAGRDSRVPSAAERVHRSPWVLTWLAVGSVHRLCADAHTSVNRSTLATRESAGLERIHFPPYAAA